MKKVTQVVSFNSINKLNEWLATAKDFEYVDLKINNPDEDVSYFFLIIEVKIEIT